MGLHDIIKKYGMPDNKEWFTLEEPQIRMSAELNEYIDYNEGKLVELKPVPEELQPLLEQFKEIWDKLHDPEDLSEY